MNPPKIVNIPPRKLAGMRIRTSMANDQTRSLWQRFRPRIKDIPDRLQSGMYSVQILDPNLQQEDFTPHTEFEKWAAVEVSSFDRLPDDMEGLVLSGGAYAVYTYKGPASAYFQTYHYVVNTWLPGTPYELDHREQFEIMGDNYHPMDPEAEEEVWIPVREKTS